MKQCLKTALILAVMGCTFGLPAQMASAEQPENFEQYFQQLQKLANYKAPRAGVASISSGFGASDGQTYIAISYTDRDTQTNGADDDGSIAIGYGFGDPVNSVGLELTTAITSVSTGLWGDGNFGDEGNLSVKIHKRTSPIFGSAASAALGASNLTGWGGTREVPTNYSVSYSEINIFGTYNEYASNFTIGYGTGIAGVERDPGAFLGVGLGRGDFSGSLAYNGDEFNAGLTYYIPRITGGSLGVMIGDLDNAQGRNRIVITLAKSW